MTIALAVRAAQRAPVWLGVLLILLVSGTLLGVGFAIGLVYCEARRVREFQQLADVTKQVLPVTAQCMATLRETVPGALITAMQARPVAPRPLPVAVRDSLRERRWTTPRDSS